MFEVGLFTIFEIKIEYISLEDNLSRIKILAPLITLMILTYVVLVSVNVIKNYFEYSIKPLRSLRCFNPGLSLLLIKNWYFLHIYLLDVNVFYQYVADYLLNLIMHLFFQIQNLQLLIFCMDDLEYMATMNYALFYFH